MWAVGGIVEYAVDSVGLGDESGVAECVAEPDPESGNRAGLCIGPSDNGEGHEEGGQCTQQQKTGELATGSLYYRRLAVQPEHAQHEDRQQDT